MINKSEYTIKELSTGIGRKSIFTGKHTRCVEDLIDAINMYDLFFTLEMIQWIINNNGEINGCGSKNGIRIYQHMWFLFIGWACFLHDAMWGMSKNKNDVIFSNEKFDNNLKKIVNYHVCVFDNYIINYLCTMVQLSRYFRIGKYVTMVEVIGTPNFFRLKGFD